MRTIHLPHSEDLGYFEESTIYEDREREAIYKEGKLDNGLTLVTNPY